MVIEPGRPREHPKGASGHVTSSSMGYPVSISVMRNGTFCTTTIVRKKRGNRLRMRTPSLTVRAASGHVTSGDVTSGSSTLRSTRNMA